MHNARVSSTITNFRHIFSNAATTRYPTNQNFASYWTIQVLQNCVQHLKTLRNPLNKDPGLLEGRGGQHTSPCLLAYSQSPIEDRTGQNRAGPGDWMKRGLLWLHLLKRRSPEQWCWQCGKMCFSLNHEQECMSTHTHKHTLHSQH